MGVSANGKDVPVRDRFRDAAGMILSGGTPAYVEVTSLSADRRARPGCSDDGTV
ncbi:MAG: hypothetical protein H7288_10060 [Kineosporiaceae bacterium]|nr:hypothetical protein [Aeromicrobium sp.]